MVVLVSFLFVSSTAFKKFNITATLEDKTNQRSRCCAQGVQGSRTKFRTQVSVATCKYTLGEMDSEMDNTLPTPREVSMDSTEILCKS